MPKFKKIVLRPTQYVPDNAFYVDVQINVDSKGVFSCLVPAHLKPSLQNKARKLDNESVVTVEYDEIKHIKNPNYEKLLLDLQLLHDAYSHPAINKKLVIAYQVSSDVAYAVDDKLNIHKTNVEQGVDWSEFSNDDKLKETIFNNGLYGLNLAAKVYVQVTKQYGDTKEVKYELPSKHTELLTPAIESLNSWCGVKLEPNDRRGNVEVVDYTEETAKFFDDMLYWMVSVSDKLQRFFSKPNHIELINSGLNKANLLGQEID